MALTKIDDRGLKTPIDLLDNEKIRFGTGNDLEIFHDGSNSYIADTGTGRLLLKGSGIRLHNAAGNENYIHCDDNGAIELYYDNVKKFETIPAGCRVSSGNLYILDNSEINIGNGNDLKIYHNGTKSYIQNSTGNLEIQSDNFWLEDKTNGHGMIHAVADGAVELYYDNSKKLNTRSDGVDITGILNMSSHIYLGDSDYLICGASNDLQIYHNGTNSQINDTTSQLYIQSDLIHYRDWANGHYYCKMVRDGAVELYYDGGKKLETTSTGAILTSGAANTTAVRFGNTANRGLTISTYNNAGNNDSGVVLNAADSENSGYAATLEFDLGGVEFGRFDGNYDIFKLASACNGITFNGDYAAANRLNDYEEGTFNLSPNLNNVSYTAQQFTYTKIGNVVHFSGRLAYSGANGVSDQLLGLPFLPNGVYVTSSFYVSSGLNIGSEDFFTVYTSPSASRMHMSTQSTETAYQMPGSADFYIAGFYKTNS